MTKFIDRIERRWGNWAIPHLTRWIVLLNAMGYCLIQVYPQAYGWLLLDVEQIAKGEIWRLVTYLFIPPSLSPIWIVFVLYFTYLVGEGIEQEWGPLKFNLYYLLGMIATTLIAFFLAPGSVDNTYLNTSLFLAFATLYPDYVIYLFFVLPVKVKWLAWLTVSFLMIHVLFDPLPTKCAILVSVANYSLFFGKSLWETFKQQGVLRRQVLQARARFHGSEPTSGGESFHCCTQCGRTEVSDPDLVFRVARDGEEYCVDHLPRSNSIEKV